MYPDGSLSIQTQRQDSPFLSQAFLEQCKAVKCLDDLVN